MHKMKKSYVLIIMALLFSAACTKKRDAELPQGESLANLHEVAKYQNKEFAITTKSAIFADEKTISSSKVETGSSNKPLLPLVKYETTAPFLKAFDGETWPLAAKENTTGEYSFLFQITDTNVVVYKKAKKENLTDSDLLYATAYGDFMIAPQMTIPITLYKVENVRVDGQETHIIGKYRVSSLSDATYFEPDMNNVSYLKLQSREFVFPTKFFNCDNDPKDACEWFFAQKVVALKETANSEIVKGQDLSMDFNLNPVSRVKFVVDQFQISARNMNIDPELLKLSSSGAEDKTDINTDEVLNIGSTAVDYRLRPVSGSKKSMDEETLDDRHSERRPWKNRKYLKLDFNKLTSVVQNIGKRRSSTPTGESGAVSLVSLNVDSTQGEEYFGVTVLDNISKIKIRYSMKRAHKPKDGKLAFETDMKKNFGFFTTEKHFIKGPEYVRRKDFEKNTFINRFNPQLNSEGKRVIEYYLTDSSEHVSETYKAATQKAIDIWNESFQKIGSNIEVKLNREKYVELGDIRYNIINLIEEKADGGGLLGYGPSIADTQSGEIISATANIYLTALRRITVKDLRRLVYFELGLITDKQLHNPDDSKDMIANGVRSLGGSELDVRNLGLLSDSKGSGTGHTGSGTPLALTTPNILDGQVRTSPKNRENADRINSCGNFSISKAELISGAKSLCAKELFDKEDGYISKIRNLNANNKEQITHLENEMEVLSACAEKVMQKELVHTLLHEIGHNFGLRHNFIGSYDVKNFTEEGVKREDEIKAKGKYSSSSVMDYISPAATPLSQLGPYDLAALRFGYKNEVETANDGTPTGEYVQIDQKRSIEQNLSAKGVESRKYLFCTDEDTMQGDQLAREALCMSFDSGTSATEISKNFINEFNAFWEINARRFDFKDFPYKFMLANEEESVGALAAWLYLNPLIRIYGEFRIMLAANMVNKRDAYFFGVSTDAYKAKVLEIAKKLDKAEQSETDGAKKLKARAEKLKFLDYYAASKMIKELFLKINFIPDRRCVAEMKNGQYESVAFENFKANIGPKENLIQNCQDDRVQSYFSDRGDYTRIFEIGEQYKEHQTDESTRNVVQEFWKPDVLGISPLLDQTTQLMQTQIIFSVDNLNMKFIPIILEEPEMREAVIQKYVDRLLNGLSFADAKIKGNGYIKDFSTTGNRLATLQAAISHSLTSAQEPGMAAFMSRRFKHDFVSEIEKIPDNAAIVVPFNDDRTAFRYATEDSTVGIEVLRKFDALRNRELFLAPLKFQLAGQALEADLLAIINQVNGDKALSLSADANVVDYLDSVERLLRAAERTSIGLRGIMSNMFAHVLHKPEFFKAMMERNYSRINATQKISSFLPRRGDSVQPLDMKEVIRNEIKEIQDFVNDPKDYSGQKENLSVFLGSKIGG